MQFYCPNCQQVVDTAPETTLTTKFNQTVYKAHCPVCAKDICVYGVQNTAPIPAAVTPPTSQLEI